jgi:hypothetical protein
MKGVVTNSTRAGRARAKRELALVAARAWCAAMRAGHTEEERMHATADMHYAVKSWVDAEDGRDAR